MTLLPLVDWLGDAPTGALFGVITGILFGVAAQRSAFCLRAATVEFARGQMGPRMSVWLLTFSTALVWVQAAILTGLLQPSEARIMAVAGSWSGAIMGGLMFGVGMVLARGCSGRLLVLAATGNLRSLVSGLIFAVVAQMALGGWLAPLRTRIAAMWVTPGGHNVNLIEAAGLPDFSGLALGLGLAGFAIVLARRNKMGLAKLIFASGVGFAVAVGWVLTFALSQVAFDPVLVESATFTGPSAKTLMYLLTEGSGLSFEIGLVPGVFVGAFVASVMAGEFAFQGFQDADNMKRSMFGAALMGFGGMLAGGCAIGAGVTGGSIFVATAWVALTAMWAGAMLTDLVVDQPGVRAAPQGGAMVP